jgi:hypothetical protein
MVKVFLSFLLLFCWSAVLNAEVPDRPDETQGESRLDASQDADQVEESAPADPAAEVLIPKIENEFKWKDATVDSFAFLMMQNGARFAIQDKTRDALTGPFIKDYFQTLGAKPPGFWDEDSVGTNLILHPIQGSATYHIARTNGASRTQAFWWGVAYSTHFELGPLGEAGVGNVKISPVDLIVTPSAGFLLGTTEEWLLQKLSGKKGFLAKLARFALAGRTFSQLATGRQPSP